VKPVMSRDFFGRTLARMLDPHAVETQRSTQMNRSHDPVASFLNLPAASCRFEQRLKTSEPFIAPVSSAINARLSQVKMRPEASFPLFAKRPP
jgi:hypothetical protein